ncbi:MAG: RNA polymerase sigma factor [Spirochaetes bacterium]|jgi:RNA polymerase sigma factor (sigma-70 family)|nr:RNA polymerase sigma factor [Spirochaetota bacterium]
MGSPEYAHPPSFDDVYERLFPTIFHVALRVTGNREIAEDLCHEAFIKLMERPILFPDLDQSKYWLLRVVKNLSLNHEKKRSREKAALGKLTQLSVGVSESGERQLLREELRTSVQAALDVLPYNLRAPLVFREYGELSYREIGAILGISENNVKVRVFRARERLHKTLTEGDAYVP